MDSRRPEARVGTTLRDKWTLRRLIGQGGMAAVYEGVHRIGRRDAIKVLHERAAVVPGLRERFEREARAANLFKHAGAVEIRDVDTTEDGLPFLVMELVEGETLAQRRRREPMPVAEVLTLADELLDVLAAAHASGLVHRDIKPDNLVVQADGRLKVLDFGIARLPESSQTAIGTAIGTAGYMPPEQLRGEQVDGRADLFGVGATIFRLLSDRRTHEAESDAELVFKMGTQPARSLASVVADAPHDLCLVVDRALAFRSADRYPNARVMQEDVRALREGRPPPFATAWEPPATAREGALGGRPGEPTQSLPETAFATPAPERTAPRRVGATLIQPIDESLVAAPDGEPAPPRTIRVAGGSRRRIVLAVVALPFVILGLGLLSAQISLTAQGRGVLLGWVLVALVLAPGLFAGWAAYRARPTDDAIRVALRVARARGGRVTALDLATDTSLSTDDAERVLRALEEKGICRGESLGERKVYAFPGLGGLA